MAETVTGAYSQLPYTIATTVILVLAVAFLARFMLKYFEKKDTQYREDLNKKDEERLRLETTHREESARRDSEYQSALKEITTHYTDFIRQTTEGYERCMSDNHSSFVNLTAKYEAAFKEAERLRVEERLETQKLMTQCVAAIEKNTEVLDRVIQRLDGGKQ